LSVDRFATWDESHRKVQPGSASEKSQAVTNRDTHFSFPRDLNGKLNLDDGKYLEEVPTSMKCKYTEEFRLCVGVAVVTPLDTNGSPMKPIGKRILPFDYSQTVLLSISDYETKIRAEIERVRNLKHGETAGWIVKDQAGMGKLYQNDPIRKLKKCGKVTCKKLQEVGIMTVLDLRKASNEKSVCLGSIQLSRTTLINFCQQALVAEEADRPKDLDY
jgi:hypothetical protein